MPVRKTGEERRATRQMKVYVIGAGVSKVVGYPLGVELFDAVDQFISRSGRLFNRFHYDKDWPALKRWLTRHKNPVVAEAFQSRQLEHLLTILDLAENLRLNSLGAVIAAAKEGRKAVSKSEERWRKLERGSRTYQKYRRILLWAIEAWLEFMHHYDADRLSNSSWDSLRTFANKLSTGDVILTFNYDSTLERVLWHQQKWSPKNGCGFEVVFQKSSWDKVPVEFPQSRVLILHLHGSVGWYRKPALREDYPLPEHGGAIPREALTPAPLETPVALDPIFLRELGIHAVDASLPMRPASERQIFLHPSFLKDFESEGAGAKLFSSLWRQAAEALARADEVTIIGYSLPAADSAALTLLITTCDQFKVRVVNHNPGTNMRLLQLLARKSGKHWLARPPISFEDWLRGVPDCKES